MACSAFYTEIVKETKECVIDPGCEVRQPDAEHGQKEIRACHQKVSDHQP